MSQDPGVTPALAELQQATARAVEEFIARLPDAQRAPLGELFAALAARPQRMRDIEQRYYRDLAALWASLLSGSDRPAPCPEAQPADRRFGAADWDALPYFRLIKASYQLNARWLRELVDAAELPEPSRRRASFVVRQLLDALAPTNFPATNPEVIRLALASGGASLQAGLDNLRDDLARGRMSMSNPRAFEVGRDLGVTPGAVIRQSPLVQLIQYAPRQPRVHARPLLIVPPFINKYYILDLQPHNSFVRYALDHGVQVFIVSWRNVPAELGALGWEDYMRQGVFDPIDTVLEVSGSRTLNALGFCVGGTLLASALAVMPRLSRVRSLTLLATMLDFSDVGEIGVYIDEAYVQRCEREYAAGGRVPGAQLATAFASLRANELVWRFVVDNYLKGRTPPAFDLLHWNGDSANLPGPLFAWYLRNLYLENRLRIPGALRLCGRPVDLARLRMPAYLLAAREDHIVPWHAAYSATRLLSGRIEFVLGASGHVAGVINPPAERRRRYWINPDLGGEAQTWLARAQAQQGSWWQHWIEWLLPKSGALAPAPAAPGSAAHPPLEPAPGSYVLERVR
jgi:polyhydroxyalkanoate synthase